MHPSKACKSRISRISGFPRQLAPENTHQTGAQARTSSAKGGSPDKLPLDKTVKIKHKPDPALPHSLIQLAGNSHESF
jgi:hypothetical protein